MKLTSDTFRHGETIPERCAFGVQDTIEHMKLGKNRNPQLRWSDIPDGARSLVLTCIDSDVPSSGENFNKEGAVIEHDLPRVDFVHWVMVDIPPMDGGVEEGQCSDGVFAGGKQDPAGPAGSRQGLNDYTGFMASDPDMRGDYCGYDGPCPPWNDERLHHYHFRLYAIDLDQCPVEGHFTAEDVSDAIDGHVLAEATLTGTYSLNPKVGGR